jgi:hypothetical protein
MAAITPDMVCPRTARLPRPALTPAVRESSDNIPNGSRRVRVQTVNAKTVAKKAGLIFFGRIFMKMNRLFYGD